MQKSEYYVGIFLIYLPKATYLELHFIRIFTGEYVTKMLTTNTALNSRFIMKPNNRYYFFSRRSMLSALSPSVQLTY